SAFRIPHSAFRIPHSAFRIPQNGSDRCYSTTGAAPPTQVPDVRKLPRGYKRYSVGCQANTSQTVTSHSRGPDSRWLPPVEWRATWQVVGEITAYLYSWRLATGLHPNPK
ncbi:MAG: hypothetical protein ABTR92_18400, partial [Candidatus Accumulibacter phosphatis]